MIILIPMGGEGQRFKEAGYTLSKPCIPTFDRHTTNTLPMIICAMQDIPGINDPANKIICINRDFHAENGTEAIIKAYYPHTVFIHDHVLLDQAFGCFLAREFLKSDEDLFIAACDNGMNYEAAAFAKAKQTADVLMISHTNDTNIAQNPLAHSWAELEADNKTLKALSLKQPVSANPMHDHATTGMFWFKHAKDFLKHLEDMIWQKDSLNGKYYVDKVLNYCIAAGLKVQYFDVDYICWGTPADYESYQQTARYWQEFFNKEFKK